ncbi:protransforming growth factor alpha isoform X1 [Polypterus senegalus]|uniref:protransforming growth factor alpha isoform X1 n=2 Tax=Polypterus senegalus TaxID=55291 RepID=UPI0019622F3A|nr:protransforming growth factor alpha isoform X1 [Polypterus senegalus]
MRGAVEETLLVLIGFLLTVALGFENSTTAEMKRPPQAAAFRSHFDDCPDSHSQFCFHGTCRFLVLEDTPACVCHPGFIGMRCEHADLLAVVATNQKQQTIATLAVVSVVGCVLLILLLVLFHCCRKRYTCSWSHALTCRHEKPDGLLKGGASCCHTETVV